jgi:hypothetical protein
MHSLHSTYTLYFQGQKETDFSGDHWLLLRESCFTVKVDAFMWSHSYIFNVSIKDIETLGTANGQIQS